MANYTDITAEVVTAFRDDMAAFTDDTDWPDDIVEQALCEVGIWRHEQWGTPAIEHSKAIGIDQFTGIIRSKDTGARQHVSLWRFDLEKALAFYA